jgi:hypothetical protein
MSRLNEASGKRRAARRDTSDKARAGDAVHVADHRPAAPHLRAVVGHRGGIRGYLDADMIEALRTFD